VEEQQQPEFEGKYGRERREVTVYNRVCPSSMRTRLGYPSWERLLSRVLSQNLGILFYKKRLRHPGAGHSSSSTLGRKFRENREGEEEEGR